VVDVYVLHARALIRLGRLEDAAAALEEAKWRAGEQATFLHRLHVRLTRAERTLALGDRRAARSEARALRALLDEAEVGEPSVRRRAAALA
jgi:hypothetical protein